MKLNKIFLTATLLFAGVCANAQEVVTEYVFQPHWFGALQLGGQETLGEGKFGKLLSGNAQINAGYKFSPYFGLRLAVNGWASRGAISTPYYNDGATSYYKWNYIAPTVDAVVDMTNLLGGYNPTRVFEIDLLAGIGLNIGWHNHNAQRLNAAINESYNTFLDNKIPVIDSEGNQTYFNQQIYPLNAWGGSKCRFLGQFGCALNFNVSSRVQLGIELMANVVNDAYNSKMAENTDWYFNGLIGIGYSFGPKYKTVTRVIEAAPEPEPVIVEKVVEKIVEVPVQVEEKKVANEVLRRDVFFLINEYNIRPQEMEKVAQIAEYLQSHPDAKVTITGYADKGTGSMAYNLRLSANRSQAVAKALQNEYYIPASRMIVKSMGEDMFQPYPDPVQNRVAICIAE